MTTLRLTRHRQDETGTYGVLMAPGIGIWATCEAPWVPTGEPIDWGTKGQSCLPWGHYILHLHRSPKYGTRWHIVDSLDDGKGVTLTEQPSCSRSHCMIHPANWAKELMGCIALGTSYNSVSPTGAPMVSNSKYAVSTLEQGLQSDMDHKLIIEPHLGASWE